jgi:hypothetical protein
MTSLILLFSVLAVLPQDSSSCRLLGRWPFGEGEIPRDLVNDTIAYISTGGGVYLLNVKNPANISKVGELRTAGMPYYFSVRDSLLCIGEYRGGVALYSIADLSQPRLLGRCATPNVAFGTAFDGRYAYVACSDSGVRVIDFQDPFNPSEVASLVVPDGAVVLEARGGCLFIGARTGGVRIADVSNPRHPFEIGSYMIPGDFAQSLRVRDTLLYAAFAESGLVVVNVSDPANPVKLATIGAGWYMVDLAISGDYAYASIANPPQMKVIDISNAEHPSLTSTYRPPPGMSFSGIAARGSRCYTVIREKDPRGGLRVVDLSDPANPVEVGSFSLPSDVESVVAVDGLAFAGTKGGGVQVLDISDASFPVLLGAIGDTSRIGRLCIDLPYLYAAAYGGAFLQVIDVSDPRNPVVVGRMDSLGRGHDVAVESGIAYVTRGEFLWVVDVSTPIHPTQVAKVELPSSAFGLDLSGHYCYVADWYGGIQVVDVSNPSAPRIVGSYPTQCAAAVDIVVRGQYAYYSDAGGFGILDVSDPTQPTSVFYQLFVPPVQSWGIDAMFTTVFVTLGDSGLGVYDATDPARPVLTGFYRTPYWAYHVFVQDNIAYVADLAGFCIIQYFGSGVEEGAGPIPAPPRIKVLGTVSTNELVLELKPTDGRCEVALLDVTGRTRLSSSITASAISQGRVRLDVSRLPAGVYFTEVRTQSDRRLAKVLLAR